MTDRELRKYHRFYSPGHRAMSVLFVLTSDGVRK
jgi:hypothetical protein